MQTLEKIIAPVDFSERSGGALRYAALLARHFRSELVLLHVFTPPAMEFGDAAGPDSVLSELYRNRAREVAKELDQFQAAELAGLVVRRVVREGDTAHRIVEFAHDEHAGLIVMATHGYGPFRRFILGSNTAKVLHDADCPVWTGAHLEHAPPPAADCLRRILCAVDLGPQSSKTLDWAMGLQTEFAAELTLVHATAPFSDDPEAMAAEWLERLRQNALAELESLRKQTGARAELLVESGEPAHVISSVALRINADALVIARGSASGVFGRLRTNAYAIIRQSPCPVVSV
ncbi:MAG TPA: universal stress protein [Bryobacteraceae bacterium]|nr:universal stress protein [Bryobacteraceae bacterium]